MSKSYGLSLIHKVSDTPASSPAGSAQVAGKLPFASGDLCDPSDHYADFHSRQPGNLAMHLPKGLHGVAAKKVVTLMTKQGFIEEVKATLQREGLLYISGKVAYGSVPSAI